MIAMNHASAATLLYRIATGIEVLSTWLPPVKRLFGDQVAKINAIADWHQHQAMELRR